MSLADIANQVANDGRKLYSNWIVDHVKGYATALDSNGQVVTFTRTKGTTQWSKG